MTTRTEYSPLFGEGNTKLGKSIFTFSLPAVSTCPGSTKACRRHCYALAGYYVFESTRKALRKRLRSSRRADFVARMVAEVKRRRVRRLRIHVSGDFYDAAYVRKWLAIVAACPHVRFFAYTRSWRVSHGLATALRQLSELPNIQLWYSLDQDSGTPAYVPPRVRLAYMATNDYDFLRPRRQRQKGLLPDLVFRVNRKTVQKRQQGVVVCPVENGVTKTTCEQCRLCIDGEARDPRRLPLPVVA